MIEAKVLAEALTKHLGPGPHPDGSPQSVHGRRGHHRHHTLSAPWLHKLDDRMALHAVMTRYHCDRDMAADLLNRHDVYTVDGMMCVVQHEDVPAVEFGDKVTPQLRDQFLAQVHRLQVSNPIHEGLNGPWVVNLTTEPFVVSNEPPGVGGFTSAEPSIICIRPSAANMPKSEWKDVKRLSRRGHLMPVGEREQPIDYLLAHEWGHAWMWDHGEEYVQQRYDFLLDRGQQGVSVLGVSNYAMSNPMEFYAEMFAQYVLGNEDIASDLGSELADGEDWNALRIEGPPPLIQQPLPLPEFAS